MLARISDLFYLFFAFQNKKKSIKNPLHHDREDDDDVGTQAGPRVLFAAAAGFGRRFGTGRRRCVVCEEWRRGGKGHPKLPCAVLLKRTGLADLVGSYF